MLTDAVPAFLAYFELLHVSEGSMAANETTLPVLPWCPEHDAAGRRAGLQLASPWIQQVNMALSYRLLCL